MITGPPYELVYKYWPLYEDAFWRFRYLLQLVPEAQVTSWFRDERRNAEVGGAPRSQHLLALAIDVQVSPGQMERLLDAARWLGLYPIRERNHVHVQRYEAGLLPAFLFGGE
jgi:uncharacterized protein YcbK (DUF882 family)